MNITGTSRTHSGGRRITTSAHALISTGLGRVTTSPNNYTVGNRFALTNAAHLIGAKITHKLASEGVAESVKVKAYDSGGSLLGSTTISITSSGLYSVTFPGAYTIPAETMFAIAVYNTTGAYPKWTYGGVTTVRTVDWQTAYNGGFAIPFGDGVIYLDGVYDLGDVNPTTRNNPNNGSAPQLFAADPVLDYD